MGDGNQAPYGEANKKYANGDIFQLFVDHQGALLFNLPVNLEFRVCTNENQRVINKKSGKWNRKRSEKRLAPVNIPRPFFERENEHISHRNYIICKNRRFRE
jgi:hypothetical protein